MPYSVFQSKLQDILNGKRKLGDASPDGSPYYTAPNATLPRPGQTLSPAISGGPVAMNSGNPNGIRTMGVRFPMGGVAGQTGADSGVPSWITGANEIAGFPSSVGPKKGLAGLDRGIPMSAAGMRETIGEVTPLELDIRRRLDAQKRQIAASMGVALGTDGRPIRDPNPNGNIAFRQKLDEMNEQRRGRDNLAMREDIAKQGGYLPAPTEGIAGFAARSPGVMTNSRGGIATPDEMLALRSQGRDSRDIPIQDSAYDPAAGRRLATPSSQSFVDALAGARPGLSDADVYRSRQQAPMSAQQNAEADQQMAFWQGRPGMGATPQKWGSYFQNRGVPEADAEREMLGLGRFSRETPAAAQAAEALRSKGMTGSGVAWNRTPEEKEALRRKLLGLSDAAPRENMSLEEAMRFKNAQRLFGSGPGSEDYRQQGIRDRYEASRTLGRRASPQDVSFLGALQRGESINPAQAFMLNPAMVPGVVAGEQAQASGLQQALDNALRLAHAEQANPRDNEASMALFKGLYDARRASRGKLESEDASVAWAKQASGLGGAANGNPVVSPAGIATNASPPSPAVPASTLTDQATGKLVTGADIGEYLATQWPDIATNPASQAAARKALKDAGIGDEQINKQLYNLSPEQWSMWSDLMALFPGGKSKYPEGGWAQKIYPWGAEKPYETQRRKQKKAALRSILPDGK